MPSILHPATLQPVYVPGVYSETRIVSDLAGSVPAFQVPVILGSAEEGFPYDVADSKYAHEDMTQWVQAGTASAAGGWFGADSDLKRGMKWSKRHGLPTAFMVCMSALVRATVVATSTGPTVNQITIASLKYGAPGSYIKLKVTAGPTLEITPLKNYSRLTATAASTSTRVYLRDNSWVKEGQTYTIGANGTTNVTRTVKATRGVGTELDANGQITYWVEFTATVGASLTAANYAMVVEYDENQKETPDAFASVQAAVDWLQDGSSKLLTAKKESTFDGAALVVVSSATALKDITAWGTVTEGESPAATSTEYDDFISDMNASEWDAFAERFQVIPQAFLALSSSSTIHQALRDWEVAKRTEGYPISVTAGCAYGDTVLSASDDTNPAYRAAALNNQGFCLVAGGLDKLGAWVSTAAAVFGRRLGSGIPHNLTNDDLLYSEVEARWDERNSGDLTALHKGGVCTYRLSAAGSIRWRVSQGLSTLQSNANSWNVTTKDTPLIMQRDMADWVDRIVKVDLEGTQVGADEVTAASVASVVLSRLTNLKDKMKLITGFKINAITKNASGAGWDLDWQMQLPTTTDFIAVTTTIYIGE